jgi:hypothetical protein
MLLASSVMIVFGSQWGRCEEAGERQRKANCA